MNVITFVFAASSSQTWNVPEDIVITGAQCNVGGLVTENPTRAFADFTASTVKTALKELSLFLPVNANDFQMPPRPLNIPVSKDTPLIVTVSAQGYLQLFYDTVPTV